MMGYGNKNGRTRFGSEGDEVWTKEVRGTWNWESLPIPLVCRPPKWNMRCCFFLVFIGSHRGSQEGQRWTGLCGEMNGNQNGEQLGAQDVHYGESADADALQTYSLGCSWSHCCTTSHITSTKCRASGWRRLHESLPHL